METHTYMCDAHGMPDSVQLYSTYTEIDRQANGTQKPLDSAQSLLTCVILYSYLWAPTMGSTTAVYCSTKVHAHNSGVHNYTLCGPKIGPFQFFLISF